MSLYQFLPTGLVQDTTVDLTGTLIPDPSKMEGSLVFVKSTKKYYRLSLSSGEPLSSSALATNLGGASRWLEVNIAALSNQASPYFIPVQQPTDPKPVLIEVVDWGVPVNGTIVLVPGSLTSAIQWQYQIAQFSLAGYRVIVPTPRGQGNSSKPSAEYNFDVYADDLKQVLDALGVENAKLVGESLGASITLHYVVRHNNAHVNKLCLVSPGTGTNGTLFPPGVLEATIVGFIGSVVPPFNGDYPATIASFASLLAFGAVPPLSADFVQQFVDDAWLNQPSYSGIPGLDAAQNKAAVLGPDAPLVSLPTLILSGANDVITPLPMAQELAGVVPPGTFWPDGPIPGAVLQVFANSGHTPQFSEQPLFNTSVLAF